MVTIGDIAIHTVRCNWLGGGGGGGGGSVVTL